MRVMDIYRKVYEAQCEIYADIDSKYQWFVDKILGLTTYDYEVSELFGWKIIDVCKAILDGKITEYIKDETNNTIYILVCNLLNSKAWIKWGADFTTVSFCEYGDADPIVNWWYWDEEGEHVHRVAFCEKNLRSLIEFIEED